MSLHKGCDRPSEIGGYTQASPGRGEGEVWIPQASVHPRHCINVQQRFRLAFENAGVCCPNPGGLMVLSTLL